MTHLQQGFACSCQEHDTTQDARWFLCGCNTWLPVCNSAGFWQSGSCPLPIHRGLQRSHNGPTDSSILMKSGKAAVSACIYHEPHIMYLGKHVMISPRDSGASVTLQAGLMIQGL